jgi:hexokinase
MESSMKVLVVDVGGTRLKILATATPMHSWEDFAMAENQATRSLHIPREGSRIDPLGTQNPNRKLKELL